MNETHGSPALAPASESPPRTSAILREILTANPDTQTFSVERILASLGTDRLETSLLVFSLPAIVPVPAPRGMVTLPTAAVACHLILGKKRIKIPPAVLRKSVTRRALAVAIHAVLPLLEAAEKAVKPRWSWINHRSARCAVGLFIFLLALAIAFPLVGFNALHATSIFVMALGMAEQDGLAVLAGGAIGVLSLALFAVSGLSARGLRAKAAKWLRKIARRLSLDTLAKFLRARGFERLARLVTFQWSKLIMLWDPERRRSGRAGNPSLKRTLRGLPRVVAAGHDGTPLALPAATAVGA